MEEKLIEDYIKEFGELPPQDEVISYYDELYQNLFKEALEKGEKITAEKLESVIDLNKYDLVQDVKKFKNFKK